jgi:hypothetical protein
MKQEIYNVLNVKVILNLYLIKYIIKIYATKVVSLNHLGKITGVTNVMINIMEILVV